MAVGQYAAVSAVDTVVADPEIFIAGALASYRVIGREPVIVSPEELPWVLAERLEASVHGSFCRNLRVEELLSEGALSSVGGLRKLSGFLAESGTFDLNTIETTFEDVDGESRPVLICRAADTIMRPMGDHYWVRDNAIIGARLLFLPETGNADFNRLREDGREILLSCLTIMSSRTQLERFNNIIRSREFHFTNDRHNWPHIFLNYKLNLNGAVTEQWSHKQDAFQMLAYFTLDALEKGVLSFDDLTDKHKAFLGKVAPFLAKVRFFFNLNSGTWEEGEEVRSSVLAWEVKLLEKIGQLSDDPRFDFLKKGFDEHRDTLCPAFQRQSFKSAMEMLERAGAEKLNSIAPDEEPFNHRQEDATLIYLLQLNIPDYLREKFGRDAAELERELCAYIGSLHDPNTGGLRRYFNDHYQRCGWFRGSVDRTGPEAAWSHPAWQLSAWAGERFRDTGNAPYFEMQKHFFREALRTITGTGEWSAEEFDGERRVIPVKPCLIPECIIGERHPDGRIIRFPSPHTPLNWAVAEAISAFVMMEGSLKRIENKHRVSVLDHVALEAVG